MACHFLSLIMYALRVQRVKIEECSQEKIRIDILLNNYENYRCMVKTGEEPVTDDELNFFRILQNFALRELYGGKSFDCYSKEIEDRMSLEGVSLRGLRSQGVREATTIISSGLR